jgi:hypothetical protein
VYKRKLRPKVLMGARQCLMIPLLDALASLTERWNARQ